MTKLVYFAWVRERIGKGEEEIALPASARAAASAEVKFENRKVPVENARILDAFKPLERHVYVIDL